MVAVVSVALTVEASVIARPLTPVIKGNVPVAVVSMMVGVLTDKSLEEAAAMLVKAACPAVGLVNFVMVTVMAVDAAKVPVVSLTVNLEPESATEQAGLPEPGAVTVQTESEATAMPVPDNVTTTPALAPAVMALLGVNETVAVVSAALTAEVSVMARPDKYEIPGNVPAVTVSMVVGAPAEKSLEVAAAMLAKAFCPAVGVVNFVMVTPTAAALPKVPVNRLMNNTPEVNAALQVAEPEATVTVQAESEAKAMPAPDSVILIPAFVFALAVMAPDAPSVNENVAVVAVAFTLELSVTPRAIVAPFTAGARTAKMANAKVIAFILLELK